jgi:branched-chain amino acid transport system substrate-binding protein
LATALALAVVFALAGCSADQSTGGRVSGDFATVFSSLPLQGPHAEQSQSIINAEKLALRQAQGRAGKFKINFAATDDATSEGVNGQPGWNPNKVADNARSAVQNSRTIAYLGDFDSGATAISLPITNGAGIVQVSPASTAVGLTRFAVGADKGEPDKFYPSGKQTFARVVPADDVQASAAAQWAGKLGARNVYLLGDKSLQGDALIEQFRVTAEAQGLKVVGERTMDPRADDYAGIAKKVAQASPDTVFFGGGAESNALPLWRDLHAAVPGARLMGTDGLLVPTFYSKLGSIAPSTYLTSSVQDLSQLPAAGKQFVREYRKEFGSNPDPYGAYGYASMQLLLDAIERAGRKADQRGEVVKAVLATRDLDSPVGTFSIDAGGDTSLNRIAGYRIANGKPVFTASLSGKRSPAQKQ